MTGRGDVIGKYKLVSKVAYIGVAIALFATSGVAIAASDNENTTINVSVGSTISMTTTGTVNLAATPVSGASKQAIDFDSVKVSTNNSSGYNLKIKDSDATLTLNKVGGGTIANSSATPASPSALSDNTWGWRVDSSSIGSFGAGPTSTYSNGSTTSDKFATISTSDYTIKTTSTTASDDETKVFYSIRVNTSTPSGVYTDIVTYTATTNP